MAPHSLNLPQHLLFLFFLPPSIPPALLSFPPLGKAILMGVWWHLMHSTIEEGKYPMKCSYCNKRKRKNKERVALNGRSQHYTFAMESSTWRCPLRNRVLHLVPSRLLRAHLLKMELGFLLEWTQGESLAFFKFGCLADLFSEMIGVAVSTPNYVGRRCSIWVCKRTEGFWKIWVQCCRQPLLT